MDFSVVLVMLVSWIVKRFPSLQAYSEYAVPLVMSVLTAFGIFTNLLPEPSHKYPVPDVSELEKELSGGGAIVIKLARFTRSIVIIINWFLGTVVYQWFYNGTNAISAYLPKFKKKAA